MFQKKFMAAGLAVVVLATGIPGNLVQAKAPSLIAKKTITVEKSATLKVKANGSSIKKATWKSSDKKIVTVKSKGKGACKITGVKAGSTKVVATVFYKSGRKIVKKKLSCKVVVKKATSAQVVSDPVLAAMQKGDFSYFAGTYIATSGSNDNYGGGKKLNPLELKKDGSVSGGGSYYSSNSFPEATPASVEKKEDGSYVCTWDENKYYIIYPVGVIDEMDAKVANQSYLKDIVYIRCVRVGGGVFAPIYHAKVVTNYSGNDWVAKDAFTEEIGRQFISGTGKEYKVVAIENNMVVDSGRTRVVLETKDGKRWMIQNIPAFEYDSRTEIAYYDIYEYVSDPDYAEYSSRLILQ